ncbi:hypothetical protein IGI04_037260, partial [Brassica rapa subsp. trilocularis]
SRGLLVPRTSVRLLTVSLHTFSFKSGNYTGKKFCSEPTFFTASGQVGSDGSVIFKEEDEIGNACRFSLSLRTLRVVVDPLGTVIQWLCLPEAEVTRKFCRRRTSRTRPLLWKRGLVEDHKEQPEVIEVFESL